MEFIKIFGFNDNDILDILNNNYDYVKDGLVENKENIMVICKYFLEIGILKDTIKEIFMYQVGVFFKTIEEIKMSFEEYELDSIVKSLNYDINSIELIDFI